MLNLVKIRDYLPEDKNFVYASWLRGAYYGEAGFQGIPKPVFMKHHHDVIEGILANPEIDVKVACLKDDESVILGYSVYSKDALFWVFVKAAWRKAGIAKSLVSQPIHAVTHITAVGRSILKKHPGVIYNPYFNYN